MYSDGWMLLLGLILHVLASFPPAVDEGGGDGNPDPDRGRQSVRPPQHGPH